MLIIQLVQDHLQKLLHSLVIVSDNISPSLPPSLPPSLLPFLVLYCLHTALSFSFLDIPPMEIISVSSQTSGAFISSDGATCSIPSITPPLSLDNLRRTLYYYSSHTSSINTRSLDQLAIDQVTQKLYSKIWVACMIPPTVLLSIYLSPPSLSLYRSCLIFHQDLYH